MYDWVTCLGPRHTHLPLLRSQRQRPEDTYLPPWAFWRCNGRNGHATVKNLFRRTGRQDATFRGRIGAFTNDFFAPRAHHLRTTGSSRPVVRSRSPGRPCLRTRLPSEGSVHQPAKLAPTRSPSCTRGRPATSSPPCFLLLLWPLQNQGGELTRASARAARLSQVHSVRLDGLDQRLHCRCVSRRIPGEELRRARREPTRHGFRYLLTSYLRRQLRCN